MRFYLLLSLFLAWPHFAVAEEPPAADASKGVITLSAAIHKALTASPRLQSADAELAAAKGGERQASYLPNPEAEIEAENIGGRGDYSGLRAAETTLGLSQLLETGGKRNARKEVAAATTRLAALEKEAARLDLTHDVTVAFARALVAEEKQVMAAGSEKLARDVRKNVAYRVAEARDPLIEGSRAEIALATSAVALQQAMEEAEAAKRRLASFWGGRGDAFTLDKAWLRDELAPAELAAYAARLENTLEARTAKEQMAQRQAALRLEKALASPDPTLRGVVRDFRESGDQAFVVGLSFPLAIANRNQGNIEKAQAEVVQAESETRQAALERRQQLDEQWQLWRTAHREVQVWEERILPQAEEAFKLARHGYDVGRFSYLEVLDAQRTLFEARRQVLDSLLRLHEARADVERLTASAEIHTKEQSHE